MSIIFYIFHRLFSTNYFFLFFFFSISIRTILLPTKTNITAINWYIGNSFFPVSGTFFTVLSATGSSCTTGVCAGVGVGVAVGVLVIMVAILLFLNSKNSYNEE